MLAPIISSSVETGQHARKSRKQYFSYFFLELNYKAFYSARYTEYGKYQSKVVGHLVIYNRKECRMHNCEK